MRLIAAVLALGVALVGCTGDEVSLGRLDCTGGLGDADGDGICDAFDRCPGDDLADADGDGLCDSLDRCPGISTGDADGDGLCDAIDTCDGPDNDVDADGDGVCDANDQCPGEDDRPDSDGDGIADCLDPCDYDGPSPPALGPLPAAVGDALGFLVTDISLNESGRIIRAPRSSQLRVRFDYEVSNCDCPGCIEQLYLGLTADAQPQLCAYDAVPGCFDNRLTFDGFLQLPDTPGQIGIRIGHTVDFQCILPADWRFMRQSTVRQDAVAVICVE